MKFDINKKQWIDLVFEGRNKSYGAYELRTENPKTTVKALIIGALVFTGVLSLPLISNFINETPEVIIVENIPLEMPTVVNLPPVERKEEKSTPLLPSKSEKVASVKDVKRFVKPVVVNAEDATDEVAENKDFKDSDIGLKNSKGSDVGTVIIDLPTGNETNGTDGPSTEGDVYNMSGLEVKPDFPGGMAKFYAYVAKNFKTPEVSSDLKGRVIVNFVVEKDGSLSDINVIRDLGFGTGKEAIRILKASPKWNPGIQNGRPVRVLYSLPIVVNVKS
ncbi:energy transducer TonB [Flavobacterium sp. '19STA2R22 D10 B1']|uniref:energy transducer TonB n=1 Tax=Flavobacterium aerium TaxID=3037261 RepID=UPI00278C056A|nr:energy transducer TonB [Flavobacterium sp. '19STA2R22 D10 B1']